jgi:hypothetical protein
MKTETANAPAPELKDTAEAKRLAEIAKGRDWRRWGPYLAERQWGTVREDYTANGDAWENFPFEQALSRAYRWGEDGIAGFSDDRQRLCLSLAMWNGADPYLKERLYGLSNAQGNHGEDVKELYYYLDGAPSHAYMRMLYKYPQARFPYERLREENARRGLQEREFELIDTGVFDANRYFDVEVEYAKGDVEDILLRIKATNRGPDPARLSLLPQIFFRNRWSWSPLDERPELRLESPRIGVYQSDDVERELAWDYQGQPLFCDNDTNYHKLWGQSPAGFPKDGINDFVVQSDWTAVNPAGRGTKAAVLRTLTLGASETATLRLRLRPRAAADPFAEFDAVMAERLAETDAFYAALQTGITDADARLVQRQAYAGLLWCKQFYGYDIRRWLAGDPLQPPPPAERDRGRNSDWRHFASGDVDAGQCGDILSMPDSWEYPWFAAWDLAFHCVTLATLDPAFAKSQLTLLTQARLMHPNGQLPAYEWSFDDVNPPVHAWAALHIYDIDRQATGLSDRVFLERLFHKLLMNFTWWVNREDEGGRNLFQGGFLGLDNIGLFDMRAPLPFGGWIDQTDGTAWMAAYALAMLRMALELGVDNPVYEDLATKFFEHFLDIAQAMHDAGEPGALGLWDERDGFYYNVLRASGQDPTPVRIRSVVGLLPIVAAEIAPGDLLQRFPQFRARTEWFLRHRPELARLVADWNTPNPQGDRLLAVLRRRRLKALLARMLDETEFLSPHGIRSVSRYHLDHPYELTLAGKTFSLRYEPGEGETRIYGGNSNWRGPVWAPINFLLIEALRKWRRFLGDDFRIECPAGSQKYLNLGEIADELSRRFQSLFLKGADGRRVYQAQTPRFDDDPAFRDRLQFFEYFHGDTGRGCGASHQTGWTAIVAVLLRDTEQPQAGTAPQVEH